MKIIAPSNLRKYESLALRSMIGFWSIATFLCLVGNIGYAQDSQAASAKSSDTMTLEDFSHPNEKGWPQNWEAQRSVITAQETYAIQQEDGVAFFSAKGANQRVYTKNISWDPKTHPILTWRWRVKSVSEGSELIAAMYPSLDVDLMFIPVNTKYVWSATQPVGSIKEGGMFSSTEIVIRSGVESQGEWVEERVNVYEDFLKIHEHQPAEKAWGISLLGGPGIEVDFGSIQVHRE